MSTIQANLIDTYHNEYGVPKNDEDAISTIQDVFKERMELSILTMQDKEGLAEYYRIIEGRDLPAFAWMLEAIHVVSKKEKSKRTFKYTIGILRDWLKFGFGHMPSEEETEMIQYFCETTGLNEEDISPETFSMMKNMMGKYGVMKMMRVIPNIESKDSIDWSKIFLLSLDEKIKTKFGENTEKARIY